jgi:hypothetical protein
MGTDGVVPSSHPARGRARTGHGIRQNDVTEARLIGGTGGSWEGSGGVCCPSACRKAPATGFGVRCRGCRVSGRAGRDGCAAAGFQAGVVLRATSPGKPGQSRVGRMAKSLKKAPGGASGWPGATGPGKDTIAQAASGARARVRRVSARVGDPRAPSFARGSSPDKCPGGRRPCPGGSPPKRDSLGGVDLQLRGATYPGKVVRPPGHGRRTPGHHPSPGKCAADSRLGKIKKIQNQYPQASREKTPRTPPGGPPPGASPAPAACTLPRWSEKCVAFFFPHIQKSVV